MNIFKYSFDDLTKEQIEEIKPYFGGCDGRGASCTFLANYAWRDNYDLSYEFIGKYLCLSGCVKDDPDAKPIMLMPLTKDGRYDKGELKETILATKKRFEEKNVKFFLVSLSEPLKTLMEELFPGELHFHHDEDFDEYVYEKEKLITLSGRALHKKKNHLNYFLKNYKYFYTKILPNMVDEIMEFVVQCRVDKGENDENLESLHMEEDAIRRYIEHTDEDDIYSGAIYIEGQLQAIALGERLSGDTAAAHYEKANGAIRGLYQAICSEFCKSLPEEIVYVNREEDMGIENLRKAKEALRPHHKEVKYSCCFLSSDTVE